MPALRIAEQLPGAAYLQVVCRKRESRSQVFERIDGFQPFYRVGRHDGSGRCEQVGECAMMGSADASAQLVQLRQAKAIGAVDYDCVGCWNVDTTFDDRRAEQHVKASMIEIEHDLFEFALGHLTVPDANAGFRDQRLQLLLDAGNFFDSVVNEVNLPTALDLAQAGLTNDYVIPFGHEGLDGQPFRRRCRDERHLAQATQRHIQGARYRRGGQRQDIHLAAQ